MTQGAKVGDLVLGERVVLPPSAEVSGGRIVLGDDVQIGEHDRINVEESLSVVRVGPMMGAPIPDTPEWGALLASARSVQAQSKLPAFASTTWNGIP